ncbi:transmembrane protein 98-like [Pecten maximus]|uniref:transmembrane protein 98-like n=1 Tax=Pecten maximus TaxID=6579 RepID=UPI0014581E55|nr:transmembrane protein 98-like [Pecten maximus]
METMDTVVAVAIGVLATIFLASLVGLFVVCKYRCKKSTDLISSQHKDTRPDIQLIQDSPQGQITDVELDDVRINNPRLDAILQDENWVDDATGLMPHCISILKTCHQLTERLVAMTMGNSQTIQTQELLTDIIAVAKRINPRVDEVVSSMYPPLDPRLLEARCTALVLSVSHLVLVTKHACRMNGGVDWIDQSLANVEEHLRFLREASLCSEWTSRLPSCDSDEETEQDIANQITPSNQSSMV